MMLMWPWSPLLHVPGPSHCHLALAPPEPPKEGGSRPAGSASQTEKLICRGSRAGPGPTLVGGSVLCAPVYGLRFFIPTAMLLVRVLPTNLIMMP